MALFKSAQKAGPRSLEIAARSVFESQAIAGTVKSVVAGGALEHHYAGLFQYARIRTTAEDAARALSRLVIENESLVRCAEEDQGIGPSARLYRALRGYLIGAAERPRTDPVEWWVPKDELLAARVGQLRRALTPLDAEVLELRFTRGLVAEDIAFVMDLELGEVEARIRAGSALADRLLGNKGEERESLLMHAFVLDPKKARIPPSPSREPVLAIGTVVNRRYEVEALLGSGAFADVYRARDREVTDHVVALKILRRPAGDAQATRTALRELQLIASVFHPSVVQLKDHGWHDGHLWFVMPLYRGETLAERLKRGPLSRAEARAIFEPLTAALATMHRASVRHQDVKPENVFLANIGEDESVGVLPVLLDLGVAAKDAELVLAGTPAYFAPEVAARFSGVPDPPPVGPKADVFSLALTLRDALDPSLRDHVAAGAVDSFVKLRSQKAPPPSRRRDLRDLVPWFERWLAASPDGRPTADEFRRELRTLTLPAEQRARRLGFMRWAVPTAIAILTVFGSVVTVLSREASLQKVEAQEQRLRADQAGERAASIHASLEEEEARRRKLESDIARLDEQYQKSRMTREELAARLATVEGEFTLLNDQKAATLAKLQKAGDSLKQLREQYDGLLADISTLRERRDEIARELDRTKAALDGERGRRSEAESEAQTLALRLKTAEIVVDEARARVSELEARLAVMKEPPSAIGHN